MAEAESAIKGLCEAFSSGLSGSSSIWAILAPPDAVKPYAVYQVDDEQSSEVMGGGTFPTTCFFTITVYADTLLEVVTAYRVMRDGISRFSGLINSVNVQAVFYEGRTDDFDEGEREYSREIEFRMHYEE